MINFEKRLETFLTDRSETIYKIFIFTFFLFFISQAVFIAKYTKPNGPDEKRHVYISKIYQKKPFTIPFEDKAEYANILIETPATPYLYHVAMGWALHFNKFGEEDRVFLRLINALLSIVFFVFLVLFFQQLLKDQYIVLISLAFSINTFMLVYLWGSVSYDNFTNLFAIASFYYFIKFMENEDLGSLIRLSIFGCCGSLTKFTFLPLMLFFISVVIWKLFTINITQMIRVELKTSRRAARTSILLSIAVVLIFLNFAHYGSNLIKYNAIMPSVVVVRGESKAINPLSLRSKKIRNNPNKPELMEFGKFVKKWAWTSNMRTFGVCSHKGLYIGEKRLRIINFFIVASLLIFILRIPCLARSKTDSALFICCIGYLLLVFFNNYFSYGRHHVFGLALQGRYLFPVLFVLAGLVFKYIALNLKSTSKVMLIILVFSLFFTNGLYYFITHVDKNWYI